MRLLGIVGLSILLLGLPVPPAPLGAQSSMALSQLKPGDTLRVWSPVAGLERTTLMLMRHDADTLLLGDLPHERSAAVLRARVSLMDLTRIEVRRGNRRSFMNGLAGTMVGGLAGLILGGLGGAKVVAANHERPSDPNQIDMMPMVGAVVGGVFGMSGGAAIGGSIGGRERAAWIAVHQ